MKRYIRETCLGGMHSEPLIMYSVPFSEIVPKIRSLQVTLGDTGISGHHRTGGVPNSSSYNAV